MTAAPTPTKTSSDRSPAQPSQPASGSGRTAAFIIAAIGLAITLGWFVYIFILFRQGSYVDGVWVYDYRDAWAFDLEAYVHAAQRLRDEGSLYARELVAAPFTPGAPDLFYYAPPLGVAMLPIADLPISDSATGWYVLRIAAFALACALMPVGATVRIFAFVSMSLSLWAMKDLVVANVSTLLVLPYVIAWRWMDRPLGSIMLATAVAIRPGLGVFLLWQAARRQWRALAWTVGVGLVLLLATLPFVGVDGYRDYFSVVGHITVPETTASENRDFGATLMALGFEGTAVEIARIGSILLAAGSVLLSLRYGREMSFMVTLCASLLVVPLLWHQYLITLIVPLAFIAHRSRPIVLAIPLLSWLPGFITPFILLGVMAMLFVIPAVRGPGGQSLSGELGAEPRGAAA